MPTNYTAFTASPLAGILGVSSGSFYKLDPTGTVPIEPLADIIPGVTPFRVVLSMIDQETYVQNYRVTVNALQDFTDTTPNVHRELIQISVAGFFSSAPPMSLAGLPPPPTFGFRLDLLQMSNLERMADERRPIMFISPRVSLARCFIQSVTRAWSPQDGHSTPVTVNLFEARIASPFNVAALPDTDSLAAGNSSTTGGGEQSTTPTDTPNANAPAVSQAAPTFGAVGVTGLP